MLYQHALSFDTERWKSFCKEQHLPLYLAKQAMGHIYRHFNFEIETWTDISKKNRTFLKEQFDFSLPQIISEQRSQDGTVKYLLKLQDAEAIEAVLIPAEKRLTLCLSSQVGCALGCRFCRTATQGLKRHLSTEEVVSQFMLLSVHLQKNPVKGLQKITNIVYMGQGEPLHNFENMKQATHIFVDPQGLGLGQRRITLSTSGMVPEIERLSEFPAINLAVSLHSPRDAVRSEIMPINRSYNLQKLFRALDALPLKGHRHITFEYILIDGVTNTKEDLIALKNSLDPKRAKINLIPFNPFPGSPYQRPSHEKNLWFRDSLIKMGLVCTMRVTKGDDVLAACGQLKSDAS